MHINVDWDRCKSNGVCMSILPEVYELQDNGQLNILQEDPPEALRDQVLQTVRSCPEQAISITD